MMGNPQAGSLPYDQPSPPLRDCREYSRDQGPTDTQATQRNRQYPAKETKVRQHMGPARCSEIASMDTKYTSTQGNSILCQIAHSKTWKRSTMKPIIVTYFSECNLICLATTLNAYLNMTGIEIK
ncbi:hypothetical protein LOD99_13830 [Oopsacas minuta]|uniref:Uncharacterized protein n=1 Tax=Oopsacas minuta TaxID=111878 RepID=A0AAV7KJF1_9METZ|nr:hypothetical protein LOD99_13830 [Oopsacas minuta]